MHPAQKKQEELRLQRGCLKDYVGINQGTKPGLFLNVTRVVCPTIELRSRDGKKFVNLSSYPQLARIYESILTTKAIIIYT